MSETKNTPAAGIVPMTAPAGQVVRQSFGGAESSIARTAETASTAAAAGATAMVQARFFMAATRPRDWDDVRMRLLRAIERPGYAGKRGQKTKPGEAWYFKPVGSGVEGFSIRFAEEALRCMGNIDVRPTVVFEDSERRLVDVMVLDLESNISFTSTVVVPKLVERSSLKEGEQALGQRTNSKGQPVYTRAATEDEVTVAQNSAVSKVMRNEILRMLPGDIQAACTERIQAIRNGDAATNPEGVKVEVTKAFGLLNVMPSDLKRYLGHELATSTPSELTDLRELYTEIKTGKQTWHAALAAALAERGETAPAAPPAGQGLDVLTEKLRQQQAATTAGAPPAEPVAGTAAADVPPREAFVALANAAAPAGDQAPASRPAASASSSSEPCAHPSVPPSRVDTLAPGEAITCTACGEVFEGPSKRERQPGDDDGEPGLGQGLDVQATPAPAQGTLPTTPAPSSSGRKGGPRRFTEGDK